MGYISPSWLPVSFELSKIGFKWAVTWSQLQDSFPYSIRQVVFCSDFPAALSSGCGSWSEQGGFAKTSFYKELWLLRRSKKEVRGGEKLLRGTGVSLDSNTGRKRKTQPSWGIWQYKIQVSPGWEGTWKWTCIPWSGLADCWLSLPSVCYVL